MTSGSTRMAARPNRASISCDGPHAQLPCDAAGECAFAVSCEGLLGSCSCCAFRRLRSCTCQGGKP